MHTSKDKLNAYQQALSMCKASSDVLCQPVGNSNLLHLGKNSVSQCFFQLKSFPLAAAVKLTCLSWMMTTEVANWNKSNPGNVAFNFCFWEQNLTNRRPNTINHILSSAQSSFTAHAIAEQKRWNDGRPNKVPERVVRLSVVEIIPKYLATRIF